MIIFFITVYHLTWKMKRKLEHIHAAKVLADGIASWLSRNDWERGMNVYRWSLGEPVEKTYTGWDAKNMGKQLIEFLFPMRTHLLTPARSSSASGCR